MIKFVEAVLILSGMIIGVGMFGIPFSFVRAGFWLGTLELLVLSAAIVLFHLLYGEIVLKTGELHRLPGYIRIHLGPRFAGLAWVSAIFGILGTLLVYIIVGSLFLKSALGYFDVAASELTLAAFLASAGAVVTIFPLKREAFINGILTAFLIVFIIFFGVYLFPKINPENISGFNLGAAPLPYGVLLFALSGGVVIPDLITLLGRDKKRSRLAIVLGTLIPAALYFLFALAVVGVSGAATSQEAIAGLKGIAGAKIILFGSVAGLLAVFTSFIVLAKSFQALLTLDFGLPGFFSWLIASFGGLFLYFFGFKDFIAVIGAIGAVAVGADSALIIAAHKRAALGKEFRLPFWSLVWRISLYALILTGVIYELVWAV